MLEEHHPHLAETVRHCERIASYNREMRTRLRLWMSDCAAHVLQFYEAMAPTDIRVREAITGGRAYALGEIDEMTRKKFLESCNDAKEHARTSAEARPHTQGWAAAWAAAWSASWVLAWDSEESAEMAAHDASWAPSLVVYYQEDIYDRDSRELDWAFRRLAKILDGSVDAPLPLPPLAMDRAMCLNGSPRPIA